MDHAAYNGKVGAACGRWLTHLSSFAGKYDSAFEEYATALNLQEMEDARKQAIYETLAALAVSVVASSAMIFMAGQVTFQTLITTKLMSKIDKPRRTLLCRVSTEIRKAQRVVEEVVPTQKNHIKVAEFLLGAAYAEGSKLVNQGLTAMITPSRTPPGSSSTSQYSKNKTSFKVTTELLGFLGAMQTAAYDAALKHAKAVGKQDDYPLLGQIVDTAGFFRKPPCHPQNLQDRLELAMWMSHLLDQDYLTTTDRVWAGEEYEWCSGQSKTEAINMSPSSKLYPKPERIEQKYSHFSTRNVRMILDTGDTIDTHIDKVYRRVFPNEGNFFGHFKELGLSQADLMKAERTLVKLAAL